VIAAVAVLLVLLLVGLNLQLNWRLDYLERRIEHLERD